MSSLRRMIRFMRPYRWVVVLGLFTVILPVMMELTVPRMLQYVVDRGIRAGNMGAIVRGTMIMLGAALIGALAAPLSAQSSWDLYQIGAAPVTSAPVAIWATKPTCHASSEMWKSSGTSRAGLRSASDTRHSRSGGAP